MQLRLEIAEKSTNFGICGSRECALESAGTGQEKGGDDERKQPRCHGEASYESSRKG
jgi:hypothetical protein